jgi:fatty aldehyde-generating acyl-ACP reductase
VGREPAGVIAGRATDFALLGHQETWAQIEGIVGALRDPARGALDARTIREVVPWIPPRVVARMTVGSHPAGHTVHGVYIDTFITPDDLASGERGALLRKVREGVACAEREGARLVALGGFTSIVLEGRPERAGASGTVALTTGNTLAAAYIVKGVEAAAARLGLDLRRCTALVIGATGDVGTGCVRYLASRVGTLLLTARNAGRLRRLHDALRPCGARVHADTDAQALLPLAHVVIAAASLAGPGLDIARCRTDTLVCDAGYPKNLAVGERRDLHLFHGGMGQVLGTWHNEGAVMDAFYDFPAPHVAHGCLLEGIALALEGRAVPFSTGRGNITPERIEEMWGIAGRHGFVLAPFYDGDGLWPTAAPGWIAPPADAAARAG